MTDLATRLKKLDTLLARFRQTGILNLIGGKTVPAESGETFETHSPVDESLIAPVARGGTSDIGNAALAAKMAFPEWAAMEGKARKAILHRVADLISSEPQNKQLGRERYKQYRAAGVEPITHEISI